MKDLHSQIEKRVTATSHAIEKCYGKETSEIVHRLLEEFITSAVAKATTHGIHPGKVISAFVDAILAIDKNSEEMAFRVEDIHNN